MESSTAHKYSLSKAFYIFFNPFGCYINFYGVTDRLNCVFSVTGALFWTDP